MRFLVLLALTQGCVAATTAGGPPEGLVSQERSMFRSTPAHSGTYPDDGPRNGATLSWSFQTGGPVRSSPTVAGEVLFVGSGDGLLYALDPRDGTPIWSRELAGPVNSSAAVAGGAVFVGSRDGTFYALDAVSGEIQWSFRTGESLPWEWGLEGWDVYTSSPTVTDDVVLFGAGDGKVYAVDRNSGSEIWSFATGGIVRSTPAVADGDVFLGSADGSVYSLDLQSGALNWRHETEGASLTSAQFGFDRKSIISSPAVSGAAVYVGSRDGFMYALDRATGERLWRTDHQVSWAISSPAVDAGVVYSGSSDGAFVHAVDARSGEEVWRYTGTGYMWSSPAVGPGTVYIGDRGGFLRAVDRSSGELRWSYPVTGGVLSSPVIEGSSVYFGGEDGLIYALAPSTSPTPRRAVFWDDELAGFAFTRGGTGLRDYLVQEGSYDEVDADGLRSFMELGLTEDRRSVVVFALDHVPASVAAVAGDTTLFRRYLDSGGKVVWIGVAPMLFQRDSATANITAFDRAWPGELTGVDWASLNFDFYGAFPTETGNAWGLDGWWMSWNAVDRMDGIEVLATDEVGRAAAWVRNYGGPPGSGFVNLSAERWLIRDLHRVLAVAEYGLD